MWSGITPTTILADASTFAGEIDTIVLVVAGFGVALLLANWIVAKFRR